MTGAECLRRQCSEKDAAILDEIADCLEADVLAKLPNIIRYDGHGQPVTRAKSPSC